MRPLLYTTDVVYHAGPEDEDETLDRDEEEPVPSGDHGAPTVAHDAGTPAGTRPSAHPGAHLGDDLDDDDDDLDDDFAPRESRRKRLERILPDAIKRAIEKGLETGIGTLTNSRDALQGVVNRVDLKNVELPKEVAGYVLSQVDDTKNAVVRVVAREVREFLQKADLATELQRVLTSLSFEIRTEIRFKPNEAGGVTPEVKADVGPVSSPKPKRRGLRRPSAGEPEE